VPVSGFARPGYERALDAFERNFTRGGEIDAALAAVRDGEQVVSCWGGLADVRQGRPWTEDTPAGHGGAGELLSAFTTACGESAELVEEWKDAWRRIASMEARISAVQA
jgi:hypothetical protein